jgi:hypothetical protein
MLEEMEPWMARGLVETVPWTSVMGFVFPTKMITNDPTTYAIGEWNRPS